MKTSLIIASAGKGERAKFGKNKILVEIGGETVLSRTVSAFLKTGLIDEFIITAAECDIDDIKAAFPYCKVVLGGKTRSESVRHGLSEVSGDVVMIHDGARPFVTKDIVERSIKCAKEFGSAITAIPTRDTIAEIDGEDIVKYVGKDSLIRLQTPQTFRTEEIKRAYSLAGDKSFNDDGEVYCAYIRPAKMVIGTRYNEKLTYPEDFDVLKSVGDARVGTGFDCHKLVEGRRLILGGVEIPHEKGLLGHSDADVLTHAIMDAILSALSMRDIGYHVPDKDEKYKDADSMKLLAEVMEMIKEKGYKVGNVSATVMAEKPKLIGFIPKITESLAAALGVNLDKVGIGATTLEGLGIVGREEGICVHANALLVRI